MFVSFYTILKQRLKIFWSSTPTNFSYKPPLPNSKPHGVARQEATAKTHAKWSAYQILSVIIVFVILIFKLSFVSFIPTVHKRLWTYYL
jgi:hypothetical protein